MNKFEYKIYGDIDNDMDLSGTLTEHYGAKGWEVCGFSDGLIILKREIGLSTGQWFWEDENTGKKYYVKEAKE